MLEYEVISPNRLHLTLGDAKSHLLKDQDPFLSLVRPLGDGAKDLGRICFISEHLYLNNINSAQKHMFQYLHKNMQ